MSSQSVDWVRERRINLMNIYHQETEWFTEPSVPDNTRAKIGESTADWLMASTLPYARAVRRAFNENLSSLPPSFQPIMFKALQTRWGSAFLELVVARTLQMLGASLIVEPESSSGTRIDFEATFSDATVCVEAVSPVFNRQTQQIITNRNPLLHIIESLVPDNWMVLVAALPNIGPSESKQEFKATTQRMLNISAKQDPSRSIEFVEEISSGVIHLLLLPGRVDDRQIAGEPPIIWWDGSQGKIRQAVQRKRRQVRASSSPVLLAIGVSGPSTASLGDFDRALYGHEIAHLDSGNEMIIEFVRDGLFAKGVGDPTYAGVLAFPRMDRLPLADPILYMHPRFGGNLPDAILELGQRVLDSATSNVIEISPLKADIVENLCLFPIEAGA